MQTNDSERDMLGFTPFKKHANKFNYTPRYYDPQKEAREQRRAELYGTRSDDAAEEYRPGQYIRTQREARRSRRSDDAEAGRKRIWMMVLGAVLVMLFIYLLFPRLAEVFLDVRRPVKPAAEQLEGGFDPYAPITIVPNDYVEE